MQFFFSAKIDRVVNFIFSILLLILFRAWHLSVIKNEEKMQEAAKPQSRTILQRANRGAVYCAGKIPLALNRIRYRACVYYAHLRQIPSIVLEKQGNATIKRRRRKEYIRALSEMLACELNLNAERIEDLIYSQAALLPHMPFVIKENLTEKEYYRLKMLQKDFTGLEAEIFPERFYPQGKTAANLIGYMGPISIAEYQKITYEIQQLQEEYRQNLQEEGNIFRKSSKSLQKIKERLDKLKTKAYQINDLIGKSGLEAFYEKELRGCHGQKSFSVDIQSNLLEEKTAQNKPPKDGRTIRTSIICELQQYAEQLLLKDEKLRIGKSRYYDSRKQQRIQQPQPAIKGGAIVVMDPNTAEILTLATYPGFNPNDFISLDQKRLFKKLKWLENRFYIQQVFDGKARFITDGLQKKFLSWDLFIEKMSLNNPLLKSALEQAGTIKKAVVLQEAAEELFYLAGSQNFPLVFETVFSENSQNMTASEKQSLEKALFQNRQRVQKAREKLSAYCNFLTNSDKLFFLDLLRIALDSSAFSDSLLEKIGSFSLSRYWDFSKKALLAKEEMQKILKPLYHEKNFKKFKQAYQTEFLKTKREEEKAQKTYPRPYLEYLDDLENDLFADFFKKNALLLLTSWIKQQKPAKSSLRPFYRLLQEKKETFTASGSSSLNLGRTIRELGNMLKDLDFEQSLSFLKTVRPLRQLDRPLLGSYRFFKKDSTEKDLAALFYPKDGFGFMSSYAYQKASALGSVFKLVPAWASLKQQYLSLGSAAKNFHTLNPFSMIDKREDSRHVGYTLDGKPYTRYYKGGRLPGSSGRFLGEIDLIHAIERSSNPYFALLAGDFLNGPEELLNAARDFSFGEKTGVDLPRECKGRLPDDLIINKTGLYSFAMGQHSFEATPLQTAVMLSAIANGGKILKPKLIKDRPAEIRQKIFLPETVRKIILDGVDRVLWGKRGTARPITILKLREDPKLRDEYLTLKHELIGKTSTSEFMHKMGLSPSVKAEKYKDIWFGGFSFANGSYQKPELVIVVYLRFSNAGREAAPLAAQIVKKYRQIKAGQDRKTD